MFGWVSALPTFVDPADAGPTNVDKAFAGSGLALCLCWELVPPGNGGFWGPHPRGLVVFGYYFYAPQESGVLGDSKLIPPSPPGRGAGGEGPTADVGGKKEFLLKKI